mmetsp:Transcript_35944/g.108629  ORF Transcript_35944/g.108629 Transcript_35944/m.108629 type:complete len:200 (-) Transcript_35944:833-1432(-)
MGGIPASSRASLSKATTPAKVGLEYEVPSPVPHAPSAGPHVTVPLPNAATSGTPTPWRLKFAAGGAAGSPGSFARYSSTAAACQGATASRRSDPGCAEKPPPELFQATSTPFSSMVPPTAVTHGDAAGQVVFNPPAPESPLAASTETPFRASLASRCSMSRTCASSHPMLYETDAEYGASPLRNKCSTKLRRVKQPGAK